MNHTFWTWTATLFLAACAGTPPPATRANDGVACTAPHGFALAGNAGDPLATNADVSEVRVVRDPEKARDAISIHLNDGAAARVHDYTSAHVGEQMAVSVGERVVARMKVRDPLGASLLLTGASDADVAEMLAALCGR